MISWDAPCKQLDCEHLYYVYGCEPVCALKDKCDKKDLYNYASMNLERLNKCGGCIGYKSRDLCYRCSRSYADLYRT